MNKKKDDSIWGDGAIFIYNKWKELCDEKYDHHDNIAQGFRVSPDFKKYMPKINHLYDINGMQMNPHGANFMVFEHWKDIDAFFPMANKLGMPCADFTSGIKENFRTIVKNTNMSKFARNINKNQSLSIKKIDDEIKKKITIPTV